MGRGQLQASLHAFPQLLTPHTGHVVQVDFQAPVVLASAPAREAAKPPIGEAATDDAGAPTGIAPGALLRQASLKTETREVPVKPAAELPPAAGPKTADKPVAAAKPAPKKSAGKPGLAAAQPRPKKSVDKPAIAAAKPVTKPVRLAKVDPLTPLPDKHTPKISKDLHPGR